MIAIDTNLLVYAHRSGMAEHRAAREAIERAAATPSGWGFSLPCLGEFFSVVTHPASRPRPSEPAIASAYLDSLVRAGARIWSPGDGFGARWLKAAVRLDLRGPRMFDLQIAMLAHDHGATEVWTHDREFTSVPGLAVVDPLP